MFAYLWAFAMIFLSVDGQPSNASDLRQIYANASRAIAGGKLELAIESLSTLISEKNAVSPLAELAAFHLAECYFLTDRKLEAMTILTAWSSKIVQSQQAEAIHSGLSNQLVELAAKTCRSLDPSEAALAEIARYLEALSERTDQSSGTQIQLRHRISQELARRLLQLDRFDEALEVIDRQGDAPVKRTAASVGPLRSNSDELTSFQITLAWAHHDTQNDRPGQAEERLRNALEFTELTNEQTIAARFALSEALAANNRPTAALEQLNQLVTTADQVNVNQVKESWRASVDLRRAELMIRSRSLKEAVLLLEQSKLAYPDFVKWSEFGFLLARCAIAEADFDAAREHLHNIVDDKNSVDTEPRLRSQWMIGETYFLQRDYQRAIDAYAPVTNSAEQSEWRARALLQTGKCYECLGQQAAAVDNYQLILENWLATDPDLAATHQEANQRHKLLRAQLENRNTRSQR